MRDYYRYDTKSSDHLLKLHPITIFLVILNLSIFIILNLILDSMGYDFVSKGTNSWIFITKKQEYYRLFTSIFLHADIDHIINNMIILFAIGGVYEISEGKLRLITVYLLGGLLASLASMTYNMKLGENIASLGASGAIFALVGASIAAVLKNRNKLKTISRTQLIFFTFFSIYAGLRDNHTDNVAHIVGLFAGFIIGLILSKSENYRSLH